jgi:hypothetical protein
MDPYLENPAMWPSVHQGLITFIWTALNGELPPGYSASMGERLFVVRPGRDIFPDVAVYELPRPALFPSSGGVATLTAPSDLPLVVIREPSETREVFVEIVKLGEDGERVVTIIEVLSPANKSAGSRGREMYLAKQSEALASAISLIEIDLLRTGEHTVAVPREELLRQDPRWDDLVCLHRGGEWDRFEVWPRTVRDHLPRIRIPLADGDPDLTLDLQAVFNRCYAEGGYARRIDYRRAPHTPLAERDAAWARELLPR